MKKIMSFVLAMCMCVSLGGAVLAVENVEEPEESLLINEVERASCKHTPGSYISSTWKESSKFDPFVYCYYKVKWDTCKCAKCGTPYSYETDEEDFCTHKKVYVTDTNGVVKGFNCTKCNFSSWRIRPEPTAADMSAMK